MGARVSLGYTDPPSAETALPLTLQPRIQLSAPRSRAVPLQNPLLQLLWKIIYLLFLLRVRPTPSKQVIQSGKVGSRPLPPPCPHQCCELAAAGRAWGRPRAGTKAAEGDRPGCAELPAPGQEVWTCPVGTARSGGVPSKRGMHSDLRCQKMTLATGWMTEEGSR